jgi:hypothetical protein
VWLALTWRSGILNTSLKLRGKAAQCVKKSKHFTPFILISYSIGPTPLNTIKGLVLITKRRIVMMLLLLLVWFLCGCLIGVVEGTQVIDPPQRAVGAVRVDVIKVWVVIKELLYGSAFWRGHASNFEWGGRLGA